MSAIIEKITDKQPSPTFTTAEVIEDQVTHLISNLWFCAQGFSEEQRKPIEAIRDDLTRLRSAIRNALKL